MKIQTRMGLKPNFFDIGHSCNWWRLVLGKVRKKIIFDKRIVLKTTVQRTLD